MVLGIDGARKLGGGWLYIRCCNSCKWQYSSGCAGAKQVEALLFFRKGGKNFAPID
jgi:hypothetical protein